MTPCLRCWYWKLELASLLAVAGVSTTSFDCAHAQIIPDGTLGTEGSRLTPNVQINGAAADRISGGAKRGGNLFHSFSQFNVSEGQSVYFVNPAGVQNILTRVTGKEASNILGTLGVDGSANLFLLNPNGILFGKNAQLDVRGSFVGTTANSFVFSNGVEFSATSPQAPPLLTISVPIGLQFGSQAGRITSQAVSQNSQGNPVEGLSVASGSTLALIGGEIALDGSFLFATDGRVQLGSVGEDTTVGLNVNGSSLDFSLSENTRRSPITLTNGAVVNTIGDSAIQLVGGQVGLNGSLLFGQNGGSISINATQFGLDNAFIISTVTQGATKAGNIQIQASDAVTLANRSLILSQSSDSDTGDGGDIAISARTIAIAGDGTANNSSAVNTLTTGRGNGGNLTLNATESVNINNGGIVSVGTGGAGNTGKLTVRALNGVNVTDRGKLSLFTSGSGSTGNLRIETGTLRVQNASSSGGMRATAAGSGSVGSISIAARDAVEVIDGQISTKVVPEGVGRAGDITIETQRVNLRDGGQVNTDTFSGANAGNIVIQASESVDIRGVSSNVLPLGVQHSRVSSVTGDGATGNGGDVTIETPRFTLSQGGGVTTTSSKSRGNAGNITIRAKDVELDGFATVPNERLPEQFQSPISDLSVLSKLNSQVIGSDADVRGGTIAVDTKRLRLSNGANLDTSVLAGWGQGGNLVVRATDSIEITGVGGRKSEGLPFSSGLFAELQTEGIGSGGSITVETGRLNISNSGQISASTFNQGNAGHITIRADQIDLRGQNTLITTSVDDEARGNGGTLSITTDRLIVRDSASISTSTSGQGQAGDLMVNASDLVEVVSNSPDDVFTSYLSTFTAGSGDAGRLSIDTRRLSIRNGGVITTATVGSGQGSDLDINAADSVEIVANPADTDAADGLFTLTGGSGNAGNLTLSTQRLSVRNGGAVSAGAAPGSTGRGGDLTINASDLVEVAGTSNDGRLPSILSVRSRGEGHITLNVDRLLLRRNSAISATAGADQGAGNGGNITLSARFIVAVPKENSDITANAFTGSGGRIQITSQGVFGLERRSVLTPLSDITAFSRQNPKLNGMVEINTPDVDPSQGIAALPAELVDAEGLIASGCGAGRRQGESKFIVTGRGGLPYRPGDANISPYPTGSVRSIPSSDPSSAPRSSVSGSDRSTNHTTTAPTQIVEAQGWVINNKGLVVLTASAPTATPHIPWIPPATCHRS